MKRLLFASIIITACLLSSIDASSAQMEKIQSNIAIKIEAVYKMGTIIYKPLTGLYPHAGQVIRITSESHSHLTAKVDNGQMIDKGGGFFILYPDTLGKLTMKVYDNKDTQKVKLLATNRYDVINGPRVKFSIAGKKSGEINRKAFLTDTLIRGSDEKMLLPCKSRIVAFTIAMVQRDSIVFRGVPSEGNKIPEKIKTLIRKAPVGTKIFLESIDGKSYCASVNNNEIVEIPEEGMFSGEVMSFIIANE